MLYLTSDQFPIFVPFGVIGFYRYLWYLIRLAAAFTYRPVPLPEHPTYIASEDVTIIVPTIDAGDEFREAAHSWLAGSPKEIIIVTEEKMRGPLEALAESVDPRIRVLTVPYANKRLQMVHGIKHTETDIIVFADDDAIWPPTLLPYVLACFEDQRVGGVGTSQRVQPVGARFTVWEVLAAFRLSIRNIEISASTHIDGGLPCLSGRTAAYRTVILKDPEFLHGFTHDFWLGRYQLNSGDDKFLTRWMVSHGWATYVQCCKEAELLSTMKPNWRFLKQVLRWTRNTWRSDLRSLFTERYIWTAHPYVAYTMVDKLFNPFTLLVGPTLVSYLIYKSTLDSSNGGYHLPWWNIVLSYSVWLLATRTAKLLPHLWHRPQDIIYVPAFILFGYYFAIMKIYALCTLHETGWGTRAGIGDPTLATAAQEKAGAEKLHAPIALSLRPASGTPEGGSTPGASSPVSDAGHDGSAPAYTYPPPRQPSPGVRPLPRLPASQQQAQAEEPPVRHPPRPSQAQTREPPHELYSTHARGSGVAYRSGAAHADVEAVAAGAGLHPRTPYAPPRSPVYPPGQGPYGQPQGYGYGYAAQQQQQQAGWA